jgi:hypothetical protein
MLYLCGDVAAMSCSYTLLLQLGIGFYFSVHPDSVIKDILLIVPLPDSLLMIHVPAALSRARVS